MANQRQLEIEPHLYDDEIALAYAEAPTTPRSGWFRRHGAKFAILAVFLYMFSTALSVIITSESVAILGMYLLACVVSVVLLVLSRRDVLGPLGIGTLFYILGFVFGIPFRVAEVVTYSGVTVVPSQYVAALGVSIVAILAYAAGVSFGLHRAIAPFFRWLTYSPFSLGKPRQWEFIFLLAWVVVGMFTRLSLGVGMAGVLGFGAQIGYGVQGLIQYLFSGGTMIMRGVFLYRGLGAGRIYFIEFLVVSAATILGGILLGWRSAIYGTLFLILFCFWYQNLRLGKSRRSMIWIVLLACLAPMTTQLGQSIRVRKAGGEEVYAKTLGGFLKKVALRIDGSFRLAAVLDHEKRRGHSFLTNDFQIISLFRSGLSSSKYADRNIWGIAEGQMHSVSSSGPGGAFIGMGLLGVILGYLVLGAVSRAIYSPIETTRGDPALAVALYIWYVVSLRPLVTGSFSLILLAKSAVIPLFFIWIAKYLLKKPKVYS